MKPIEKLYPDASAPAEPPAGGERLLNAFSVATRLGVPVSWVRKHGARLPGLVRLGKYVRWSAPELENFIARGGLG